MWKLRNSARFSGWVFILSLTLSAQTFNTLYNFGSYSHDGVQPRDRLIAGPGGGLYGTTYDGGKWNLGTVFELLPPASPGGAWTEVVLHSFDGTDGEYPDNALQIGPNGALYGVVALSTGTGAEIGKAFELDPPPGGNANWPFTVLSEFGDPSVRYPSGPLVFGAGHALYGVTRAQNGTVYSLIPPQVAGGSWTQSVEFDGFPTQSAPGGPLAVSANGTLFGVTMDGGRVNSSCTSGCGTVFSLTPPATAGNPWTERTLYAFDPTIGDGYSPNAGVALASTGVLYGSTSQGKPGAGLMGTVYSLSPPQSPGGLMSETILYRFTQSDGAPSTAPVRGPNGVLYGTLHNYGPLGFGTIYQLTPPATADGAWTKTTIHAFTGVADGAYPNGLMVADDGTIYGTTSGGGTNKKGTVYALTP